MTVQDKIYALKVRVNVLRARGETMNAAIIKKCERKIRALEKQQ